MQPCPWNQVVVNHFRRTDLRINMHGHHILIFAFLSNDVSLKLKINDLSSHPSSCLQTLLAKPKDSQSSLATFPRFLGSSVSSSCHFIQSCQTLNSHRDFQLEGKILVAEWTICMEVDGELRWAKVTFITLSSPSLQDKTFFPSGHHWQSLETSSVLLSLTSPSIEHARGHTSSRSKENKRKRWLFHTIHCFGNSN